MAQRTAGTLLCITALRQAKKQQAIPARAGDLACDRAQGTVAAGLVLKSIRQYLDDDLPVTDAAGEQGTRFRQPVILRRSGAINAPKAGLWPRHEFLRRSNAKIPIIGDVAGATARPFTQISFGIGLQTPGDAAKQELLVRRF